MYSSKSKIKYFIFFFAILFPVIAFGALQATSEIISINQIKTTITGLEAGQSADVIVGVSLKDSKTDKVSLINRIKVDKDTSIITTSNNPIPSTVFQAHTASRIAGSLKTTSAKNLEQGPKVRLSKFSDDTTYSNNEKFGNVIKLAISFKEFIDEDPDYEFWKVGVECEEDPIEYMGENYTKDSGREFFYKLDQGILNYYSKNNNNETLVKTADATDEEWFYNYSAGKIYFINTNPGSRYRCRGYAVRKNGIFDKIEYSGDLYVDTARISAFVEDFCVVDKNTIDVLVSYYGYDLNKYSPTVYLKFKQAKAGSVWGAGEEKKLPSTPDTKSQRCSVKKSNQIRLRIKGLEPETDYYIAPSAFVEDLDNSIIQWESVKVGKNGLIYLADGSTEYSLLKNYQEKTNGVVVSDGKVYPRKINISSIKITTEEPNVVNENKSTLNKCAEYITLNASIIDKRASNEKISYWFKIFDGKNTYCTRSQSTNIRTGKVFLDISSCNPFYTVFECSDTDEPEIISAKNFRMLPNIEYAITALMKDGKDIYKGESKSYKWNKKLIIGEIKISQGVSENSVATRLVGSYFSGQGIYKGVFRIVEVDSANKEIGTAITTNPANSKIYIGRNDMFYYDLYSDTISALDESGENVVKINIKANSRYKINAIVYNLAGEKKSEPIIIKAKEIRYSKDLATSMPYMSMMYEDTVYTHYGCWDASLVMILNYWINVYPPASKAWYNVYGKKPTASFCRFDTAQMAKNAGFKFVEVHTNNAQYLKQKFLDKGIPLTFYCSPSHNSGTTYHPAGDSNHYSDLVSFDPSATQNNYISKNNYKYLDDIYVFDPAVRERNHLKIEERMEYFGLSDLRCGYQNGRSDPPYYTPSLFYGGLVAVVPSDVADTISDDEYIVKH